MSSILVLMVSCLGAVGAGVAYFAYGVSLLAAIGIWALSGPLSLVLAVALLLLPRPRAATADEPVSETA